MPKVKFELQNVEVEVEAGTSLLDAAKEGGAKMGDACGGNLACSTCHVWVNAGEDSLSEIDEGEEDILDKAFDVRAESRLGCQACVSDQDITLVVTEESIAAWYDEHPDEKRPD